MSAHPTRHSSPMPGRRRRSACAARGVAVLLAAGVLAAGCGRSAGPGEPAGPDDAQAGAPRGAAAKVVVAVGDIACAPGERTTATRCRQADVASLAADLDPDVVLALGDLQYEEGTLRAFRRSYDASWGALKAITRPVPGNHEYRTARAAGYYTYFGDRTPADPGWYARRIGPWTAYAVNTNCAAVDCAAEVRWLTEELADDTGCSLMYWHHPRFSSGEHGPQKVASRFFRLAYAHDVELVLSGHDHHYERFRPMNDEGRSRPARGVVQIVSGGGGKSHYPADRDVAGSLASVDDTFGVLRLELGATGWSSSFRGIDGSTVDETSGTCH